MANEISTKALVNELEKAVEESKELLKVFKKTEEVTTDIAKELEKAFKGIDSKTSKGIATFNKLLKETNDLTDESEELQQKKIKTEALLIKKEQELSKARLLEIKERDQTNKLYLQETKTRIAVRKEQERQLAIFKKGTKEQIKEIDAYQKKSKALNEARKKYKALAAAQKDTTKEAKDLLKNITKLDTELKEIDATVGQNQRSVGKYKDAVKGLNSTIGKLGIAAVIAKGVELLTGAFGSSREGALSMEIQMAKVTETVKVFVNGVIDAFPAVLDLFGAIGDSFTLIGKKAEKAFLEVQDFVNGSDEVTANLAKVNAEIAILEASSADEAIERIKKAFEGNVDATEKAIKSQERYLKLQLATKISISEQEKELAGLQEQRQILQDISDDDTIGFKSRELAVKAASEIAIEFGEKEVTLAKTKEKLAFEAVKQDLRRAKISVKGIQTSEQLITLIEKGDNAKKVSDTNDEAFTAAYVERRDAEVESDSFKRDQEEKFRKTARDAFEQELDILEEFTEKTIASNLDVINSEKTTQEERRILIAENKELSEDLYNDSIELIKKQGKASIDLRKDLTEEQKVKQKALLDNIDAQELLNEEDAKALFILIRKLDLGEIEEKRLKDSLKIKKDLTKQEQEANKVADDADLDAFKKQQEAKNELLEKAEEVLENQIRKQSEKRIAAIDGELEQNQKRIEEINQAIQDGNEEAKESLAIEEKRAVELEAKKEKERKKALKLEAGIAILKAFGENDGDLGKTIGDTTALIAFINSLPSFFDGTEDTGGASSPLDSNGGRLTMLHDNERVMTAEQNKKLGGISNDDLADLGAMHGKGLNDGGVTINKANDDRLISEIRDMKNVIKSMPTPSYNWNATDRMHEMTLTSHNKKETLKQRSKNIFR
jgi:hypothetical protein